MTYEIKTDYLWKKTGNVAIELPALAHSNAQWWVYKLAGVKELLLLKRETVERLARTYPKTRGGDFGDPLILVPVRDFVSYSARIGGDAQ